MPNSSHHLTRLVGYYQLMRLHKPVGILLLLWPTYWALWLASVGMPDWHVLVIFTLGVIVMRSAGCVINDIADRRIDGHVERTQHRPLINGNVSVREAWWLFAGLLLVALLLVLQLNIQTRYLSFVALLLASAYPFMKRYTHLPQVVLGAAFGWSIPMVFMAVNQYVPSWIWWLYAANLTWTVAYDTLYAMVDREDDLRIGVKSTAILFGQYDRVSIAGLQIATLLGLAMVGQQLGLPLAYWASLAIASILFIQHQWLIRSRTRAACFRAFRLNHWVGVVVWLGLILSFI